MAALAPSTNAALERLIQRAEYELSHSSSSSSSSRSSKLTNNKDSVERWKYIALLRQLENADEQLQQQPSGSRGESARRLDKARKDLESKVKSLRARSHGPSSSAFSWSSSSNTTRSGPSSASIYASLAAGLDQDSDDDEDDDEEDSEVKRADTALSSLSSSVLFLPRPKSFVRKPAEASVKSASNAQEEEDEYVGGDDEDDELAREYGATPGSGSKLRRRKGHNEHTSGEAAQQSESEKHNYPPSTDDAPPDQTTSTLLQSSRAAQDSLSNELLRMASILKKNSLAFADSLERDRKLVENAGEQLGLNLDLMTRTRGRLGEYSKKARGMGWMTFGCLITVVVCWVWVFVLIKLT